MTRQHPTIIMSSCQHCGKTFVRNFNLKRHEKTCPFTPILESKIQAGYGTNDLGSDQGLGDDQDEKASSDEDTSPSIISANEDSSGDEGNEEEEMNGDSSESEEECEAEIGRENEVLLRGPWEYLVSWTYKACADKYDELVEELMEKGHSEKTAEAMAHNELLGRYRKTLRERVVAQLLYIRKLRKHPIYRKIMSAKRALVDVDDYDEEEAIESAVKRRKFLLNRLIQPMDIPSSDSEED